MSSDLSAFDDEVLAAADLGDRAGASMFEIGYLNDDPDDPGWHCSVRYAGTRLTVDGQMTPGAAATGLARRILDGGGNLGVLQQAVGSRAERRAAARRNRRGG